MIKITHLHYKYDLTEPAVLSNIDLEIAKGDYTAIIGPNGCGKTTLIRHINGLLLPVEGDVWVDGKNTKDPISVREIRSKVGMVFQNPDNQIVGMSVEEDVAFGPGNLGLPTVEIRNRVEESLALVNMSWARRKAPHLLSNGEKQLVAIAGVLAMRPEYIILDEPTSYLDPCAGNRIMDVITGLHERGITIIHVTHDMDEAVKADTVMVMDRGHVLTHGKPVDIFSRAEWLKGLGLGVPKVCEMMWRLSELGIEIRTDIQTMDEACEEIALLLNSRLQGISPYEAVHE